MRFTTPGRKRGATARLEITSMIDVIFLLLIFFLVSARQQPPEAELASALQSEQASGSASDLEPQIVEVGLVDGAPGFRLGENIARDRDDLMELLSGLPKEGGVFIRASDAVETRWAAAAVQASEDAGFTKVTYVPVQ